MRFYFSESERRKYWFKIRLFAYGIIFVFGGLAIGALYTARETPFLALNGLYVLGIPQSERGAFISAIEPVVYRNVLARLVGSDNLLAWPDELPVPGPEFSELEVKKDFFDRTVTLHARRRERFGIWCVNRPDDNRIKANTEQIFDGYSGAGRCYWVDDEDGTLFEEAPYGKGQLFITIFERDDSATGTQAVISLGGRALDNVRFARLKRILNVTRELGLANERIEIDRLRQSVYFISIGGPTLEFSLRFDLDNAHVNALRELFSSRPPESLRYVDLTVQNKMYVR